MLTANDSLVLQKLEIENTQQERTAWIGLKKLGIILKKNYKENRAKNTYKPCSGPQLKAIEDQDFNREIPEADIDEDEN